MNSCMLEVWMKLTNPEPSWWDQCTVGNRWEHSLMVLSVSLGSLQELALSRVLGTCPSGALMKMNLLEAEFQEWCLMPNGAQRKRRGCRTHCFQSTQQGLEDDEDSVQSQQAGLQSQVQGPLSLCYIPPLWFRKWLLRTESHPQRVGQVTFSCAWEYLQEVVMFLMLEVGPLHTLLQVERNNFKLVSSQCLLASQRHSEADVVLTTEANKLRLPCLGAFIL